jgi:hypothetical protein
MKKRNSVNQIVDFLDLTVLASETRIQREVFGYDRNTSKDPNKKYADMLRRGWWKKLYQRIEIRVPGVNSRIFYFRGSVAEMENLIATRPGSIMGFLLENEP